MDKAIQRHEQQVRDQEFDVGGVPETRPVHKLEHGHNPDQPANPYANPRGIENHLRVSPEGH